MKTRSLAWIVSAAFPVLTGGAVAQADLPADRDVVYSIRATPGDPQSPVTFTVTLHLVADHADGDFVSWTIETATFDRLGSSPKQWVKDHPPIAESPDDYWTIEHADPMNPALMEFAVPPQIIGTAIAQSSAYDDLDYAFDTVYDAELIAQGQTAAAYHFQMVAAPEPEEESEENHEPVDFEESA
ncbi:MAG TPA: hypothetical protein VJZ71_08035 [Phycisphaerae bacterium]|nr:hypothetical protein [Phycisphaerae bacterium]